MTATAITPVAQAVRSEPAAVSGRVTYPLTWLRGVAALAVLVFHAYQNNRTGSRPAPGPGPAVRTRRCSAPSSSSRCSSCCRASCSGCPVAKSGTRRPGRQSGVGAAVPPDGAVGCRSTYAVVLVVWTTDQPVAARALGGPAAAPDVHPRLQRRLRLLDGRPGLDARRRVPLLRRRWRCRVPAGPGGSTPCAGPRRTGRGRVVAAGRPRGRRRSATWPGRSSWTQPSHENWSAWFSPLSRAADFGLGTGLAVLTAAGVRLGRWSRGAAGRRRRRGPRRCSWPPAPCDHHRRVVAPGVRAGGHRRAGRGGAARRPVAARTRVAATRHPRGAGVRRVPHPRAGDAVPRRTWERCPTLGPERSSW